MIPNHKMQEGDARVGSIKLPLWHLDDEVSSGSVALLRGKMD